MCGFLVVISDKKINLGNALNSIAHRGPDDDGICLYQFNNGRRVHFGFRRLATMSSLPNGKQPFIFEDKYAVVFNGAIYNYREVRETLVSRGYQFKTDVDTEVFIQAYDHWGNDCFQYFRGMWAAVILDLQQESVILSRDRFGIKPLFYAICPSGDIIISSEIKAILNIDNELDVIDTHYVQNYLKYGLIHHSTATVYENIHSFPSSSFAEHKLNLKIHKFEYKKFWVLTKDDKIRKASFDENRHRFRTLWENVINLYLTADFDVGACLSGGLDSSSIVLTVAKKFQKDIETFTLGFQEKSVNEMAFARTVTDSSERITSNQVSFSHHNVLDIVEEMYGYHDQPFPDFSIVGQWEVMREINKKGLRIIFDGQGGDELLGGYRKYYAFYIKGLFKNGIIDKAIKELVILLTSRHIKFWDLEGFKKYLGFRVENKFFLTKSESLDTQLYSFQTHGLEEVFRQDIFRYSYPPLLSWEDTNSMAHGVESRVPFMDHKLVHFLYNVPINHKIRFGYTKTLLREALRDILPEKIYKRKSKLGFSTPQNEWMCDDRFRREMLRRLENIDTDEIVNIEEVKKCLSQRRSDKHENNMLVRIYLYLIWKNKRKCVV